MKLCGLLAPPHDTPPPPEKNPTSNPSNKTRETSSQGNMNQPMSSQEKEKISISVT